MNQNQCGDGQYSNGYPGHGLAETKAQQIGESAVGHGHTPLGIQVQRVIWDGVEFVPRAERDEARDVIVKLERTLVSERQCSAGLQVANASLANSVRQLTAKKASLEAVNQRLREYVPKLEAERNEDQRLAALRLEQRDRAWQEVDRAKAEAKRAHELCAELAALATRPVILQGHVVPAPTVAVEFQGLHVDKATLEKAAEAGRSAWFGITQGPWVNVPDTSKAFWRDCARAALEAAGATVEK